MVSWVEMEELREVSRDRFMVISMTLTLPARMYLIVVATNRSSVRVWSSLYDMLGTSGTSTGAAGETVIDGFWKAHTGEIDE